MNKWIVIAGLVVVTGGSIFYFYGYWSKIQEEKRAMEQAVEVSRQQAEKSMAEQRERLATEDIKLLDQLKSFDTLVARYWETTGVVPVHENFLTLVTPENTMRAGEKKIRDDDSVNAPISYTWKGGGVYELCVGDFRTDNRTDQSSDEWAHDKGVACFLRKQGNQGDKALLQNVMMLDELVREYAKQEAGAWAGLKDYQGSSPTTALNLQGVKSNLRLEYVNDIDKGNGIAWIQGVLYRRLPQSPLLYELCTRFETKGTGASYWETHPAGDYCFQREVGKG